MTNWLYNLSLRAKLILLVGFPLIGFLIFGLIKSIDNFHQNNEMNKIETLALLSTKISALVHQTQKERGMTAGFLSSKGKKFADTLPKQRDLSDKEFNKLNKFVSQVDFSNYPLSFKEHLFEAISLFKNLTNIRKK